MSLLGIFSIVKSGMSASQTALAVTGHNIANVNTPGFSRQEVILNVAVPEVFSGGSLGTGVSTAQVRRIYDRFIQSQVFGQSQSYGRSLALDDAFSRIEPLLSEADGLGLSSALGDFFNAWYELSVNPSGEAERLALLEKANVLSLTARKIEQGLDESLALTHDQIVDSVQQVNSLAGQIAVLNGKIVESEAASGEGSANDLRDLRDALLGELSQLVGFDYYENDRGAVTVIVGMRNLVNGTETDALTAARGANGETEVFLDGMNVTAEIGLGKLGGLISSAAEIRSGPLQHLGMLTASLITEVNELHRVGYGLDGLAGRDFFNADFTVAVTDPNMVGAAMQPGMPGDNAIALEIAELSGKVIDDLGGTFPEYYGGIVASVGTQARAASDMREFDENLLVELQNRRDSVSGVSLDEEAINLVRFQRSFEAGAKMMKVTDELLETLINL